MVLMFFFSFQNRYVLGAQDKTAPKRVRLSYIFVSIVFWIYFSQSTFSFTFKGFRWRRLVTSCYRLIFYVVKNQTRWMSPYNQKNWKLWMMFWRPSKWNYVKFFANVVFVQAFSLSFYTFCNRYEEAREEEKLRNQKEDFSDMVAEVWFLSIVFLAVYFFW